MLILHTPFEVNSLATLGGRVAVETTKMGFLQYILPG